MGQDIINILPEHLANQIAAGEVVQRPSSVVKELLENAIDAKATSIKLIIKEGGKSLIQVIDNGIGMSNTDARMCFERHATSKIKTGEDLFKIRTLGFRGEAMASIAAVAQVELKTKRSADNTGTSLKIEGSVVKSHEPTAAPEGTNVLVKNLFFNVPARRNFLKGIPVEFRHIQEEFHRIALAHPEIEFIFVHNDEMLEYHASSKPLQRMVSILGPAYKNQLGVCKEELPLLKLDGYIAHPTTARKTRGDQYMYINKRYIKSPYLQHALATAYAGLIESDSFPSYVLFLEMDPSRIDINVHPTKTEVKFDDERSVYSIVQSAAKRALSQFNLSHALDFHSDINQDFAFNASKLSKSTVSMHPPTHVEKPRDHPSDWNALYEGLKTTLPESEMAAQTQERRVQSSLNLSNTPAFAEGTSLEEADSSVVFQLQNSYIVTQVKSGLLIIDQQAAHERVLYEKFVSLMDKKFVGSQQFLFPLTLELTHADILIIKDLEDEIHSLGFSFSFFGQNTIVLNGIPNDIRSGNEKAFFEGFIEQYKLFKKELKLPEKELLARSLSKKSSIKQGTKLTKEEMIGLIGSLLHCSNQSFTPDGRPTLVSIDMPTLRSMF